MLAMASTWRMPAGSLDRWPADYERGRPGWPREVVEVAGLPSTATALDVGAGTGKLTRLLVTAFAHVFAVEPAEAMRRELMARCPTAEVRNGTAQDLPLPDASVDAVFAAEAFHWFYDDQALAQIARVLRPRGRVVLMWNVPAGPWDPSIAPAERLVLGRLPHADVGSDPLDLGGLQRVRGDWRGSFSAAGFEPVRNIRLRNPQILDRDGVVAFLASMGWIADHADDERLPLLGEIGSLLTASTYRRMWETDVHLTRLA
jgi:SAM-dependent methyltransferase